MLGQPCCQNARHLLVWCHCLTTLSLCCQKKHFLSFWFGNWLASQTPNARWQGCLPSVSIVPAMQFAWATVYLWHEVSTSGWGLVGFQVFVAHSAFHQNDTKTNSFWHFFSFSCWKHSRGRSMIFALSSWNMWGTHHQSTLAIAMNYAKHGVFLLVLALGLAHTMANTTS